MASPDDLDALKTAAQTAFQSPFDAVLKIVVADLGVLAIDGSHAPPRVQISEDHGGADIWWRLKASALQKILSGEIDAANAFLSGRLRVTGDMSVMARLALTGAKG